MPGKESLRLQQYYAHPRNGFWKIIFALFNAELKAGYTDKTEFLKQKHIALWDVCHYCYRPGSLDSDIREELPNTIPELIENNPTIKAIVFNGQKAEILYKKHFSPQPDIHYTTVLSSSPANAVYSFDQKLENWQQILTIR